MWYEWNLPRTFNVSNMQPVFFLNRAKVVSFQSSSQSLVSSFPHSVVPSFHRSLVPYFQLSVVISCCLSLFVVPSSNCSLISNSSSSSIIETFFSNSKNSFKFKFPTPFYGVPKICGIFEKKFISVPASHCLIFFKVFANKKSIILSK